MSDKKQKILVGIDASEQSLNTARYISRIMPPLRTEVVLFNVMTDIPEVFYDFEETLASNSVGDAVEQWKKYNLEMIRKVMNKARAFFVENGFPEDNIRVMHSMRNKGVTRDILDESKKGYDAIAIGRSGRSHLVGVPIGSVASKLIDRVFHIPLIVVGGRPESSRIILGFDGSAGAIKAVKTIGRFLGDAEKEIVVCHVVRSFSLSLGSFDPYFLSFEQSYYPEFEDRRVAVRVDKTEPEMEKARAKLVKTGFSPDRVITKSLTGYSSRSQCLVEEAGKGGIGTIVLGRRGNSAVSEFIMGRVGKKVFHMAETQAVWVIN